MSIMQALILGVLQGLTEFLPVSSSGHLVVVPWLLGWASPILAFDLMVHLGTLAAVAVYFRRDIADLALGLWHLAARRRMTPAGRLALLLIVSAVPGALAGYLFEDLFEGLFGKPPSVAAFLLVTGTALFVSERLGARGRSLEGLRLGDALLIGLAQAVAIVPGISRSGATLSVGLLRGLQRAEAGRFAFLMALPITLGAAGYGLLKALAGGTMTGSGVVLGVGFLAAAASALLSIRFFLGYVRSHSLRPFAYYCWAAGLFALLMATLR
ncbi:MAG: undecaprenyl-diphosphate phosphatase [Chloroflexota bacterium]